MPSRKRECRYGVGSTTGVSPAANENVLRFANGCELAVSEPRYPCFKFNAVMGFNQASKLMVQTGWCGMYLAVRKPGSLKAGEAFELIPGPREVGIVELFKARMKRA